MANVGFQAVIVGKESDAPVVEERLASQEGSEKIVDDSADMYRMGKKQELLRAFRFLSITAFTCVAQGNWLFITTNVFYGISNGGTGGMIVLSIIHAFAFALIIVSLAEMASMAPTAGGQYHWVSEFAPPKWQKLLSYTAGWLSTISWIAGTTTCPYVVGYIIPALASLAYPSYTPQPYQGFLTVTLLVILGALVNRALARYLPAIEGFAAGFTASVFVTFICVLWAMGDKVEAKAVFGTFENSAGWSSIGLSMMAVQNLISAQFTGCDTAAHMAEETLRAGIVVPRAMITAYSINVVAVLLAIITFCFCLTDVPGALSSPTGYPFIQVFYETTGSTGGAIALASLMCIALFFCEVNYMASCSRQVFAFARDKGLPFSSWLSKIDKRTSYPINSIVLVAVFSTAISAIGLGSSIAYNAVVSLFMFALVFTYAVSISCLIWRRLWGAPLPHAPWSLGRAGLWINLLALLYSAYLLFWIPWPQYTPVDATSFNWAIVEFAIVMVGSLIFYYVYARHTYEGPVTYVRKLHYEQ